MQQINYSKQRLSELLSGLIPANKLSLVVNLLSKFISIPHIDEIHDSIKILESGQQATIEQLQNIQKMVTENVNACRIDEQGMVNMASIFIALLSVPIFLAGIPLSVRWVLVGSLMLLSLIIAILSISHYIIFWQDGNAESRASLFTNEGIQQEAQNELPEERHPTRDENVPKIARKYGLRVAFRPNTLWIADYCQHIVYCQVIVYQSNRVALFCRIAFVLAIVGIVAGIILFTNLTEQWSCTM